MLQLETILESLSYTCGSTFNDINFPEGMDSVCVRVHSCLDPIENFITVVVLTQYAFTVVKVWNLTLVLTIHNVRHV